MVLAGLGYGLSDIHSLGHGHGPFNGHSVCIKLTAKSNNTFS